MEDQRSVCEENNFQNIYNRHFTGVRNFMYYKTGDLGRAEDIAQESFVRMWENCAEVLFPKAKNFLITVANRILLNSFRHDKVKLDFLKQHSGSVSSGENRPDHLMEENEFRVKLEEAISSLPAGQREVFLMNRIDKMSYAEIAESLDISVKAVEKRMGLCLKNLKDKMLELKNYKF